ncbi:MAG TPA: hypothetical protein PKU82_08295, partial [Bacteroidia bacterium]|nr:hypothetical protein [Bacteroidia bacterium]
MKNLIAIIFCLLIFETVNAQWTQTNGPEGGDISSIVTDGTNLYAGTYYGGVYRSSNNGQMWTAINNGLTHIRVGTLWLNGADLFAVTDGGLYVTSNNGNSWSLINIVLPPFTSVTTFAANATNLFI